MWKALAENKLTAPGAKELVLYTYNPYYVVLCTLSGYCVIACKRSLSYYVYAPLWSLYEMGIHFQVLEIGLQDAFEFLPAAKPAGLWAL